MPLCPYAPCASNPFQPFIFFSPPLLLSRHRGYARRDDCIAIYSILRAGPPCHSHERIPIDVSLALRTTYDGSCRRPRRISFCRLGRAELESADVWCSPAQCVDNEELCVRVHEQKHAKIGVG